MFGNKNFPQLKFCLDMIDDKDTGNYFFKLLINNDIINDYYIWNDCLYFNVDDTSKHKIGFNSLVIKFLQFLDTAKLEKVHFELKSNDIYDCTLKHIYSYNLTFSNGKIYSSLVFPYCSPNPIYFDKDCNHDFIRKDILLDNLLCATTRDLIYIEDKLDVYKDYTLSFANDEEIAMEKHKNEMRNI